MKMSQDLYKDYIIAFTMYRSIGMTPEQADENAMEDAEAVNCLDEEDNPWESWVELQKYEEGED